MRRKQNHLLPLMKFWPANPKCLTRCTQTNCVSVLKPATFHMVSPTKLDQPRGKYFYNVIHINKLLTIMQLFAYVGARS